MKLLRHEFRTWLESHEPNQIAGLPQQTDGCPIANFLKSKGCEHPDIMYDYLHFDRGLKKRKMPTWGGDFQNLADYHLERNDTEKMTFGVALRILDEVQ